MGNKPNGPGRRRTWWRTAGALILALTARAAAAQTAADSVALRQGLARYERLVRQMASDSIGQLFAADGVLLAGGRAPIVGPDSVRAYLEEFSAYRVLDDSMTAFHLVFHGDTATQVGNFWQRVRIPAGDTVVARGGFTLSWVRGAAGWRVARMGTGPPVAR